MVFSCPPSELISHVLQGLAFSGSTGVSLDELWQLCSDKLDSSEMDSFHKQVIWKWLFFNPKVKGSIFIWKDNDYVIAKDNYEQFLGDQVNVSSLRIYPSPETQWKYLTGQDYSKKSKAQLGDNPFELLCEIAKRGPQGIFASELSKVTNQDPRSLTLRLKKLEDMKVINKISMFNKAISQHTSLCIHTSFGNDEVDFASLDFGDDINHSRDAEKLRYMIMQKLKAAPNGLRSLSDLQNELNLSSSKSLKKFFRRIVESLRRKGCLDKVMVRSTSSLDPYVDPPSDEVSSVKPEPTADFEVVAAVPEGADDDSKELDSSLVYCLRYLREYSETQLDGDNNDEANDDENDNDNEDRDDDEEDPTGLPKLNKVFPITTQLFHQMCTSEKGPTSMDLCRVITGSTDYRPFSRLLDTLTTYVNDNNNLKQNQKFKVFPYEGISITRSYDSEGKYKFYRYFGKAEGTSDNYQPLSKSNTIKGLNKKLNTSIGKIKQDGLLTKKRPAAEVKKPVKKYKKSILKQEMKRAEEERRAKEERKAEEERKTEEERRAEEESNSKDVEMEDIEQEISNQNAPIVTEPTPSANSMKQSTLPPGFLGTKSSRSKENGSSTSMPATTSIKSIKRREELISLIKENGGVIFTSVSILRELDRRLQISTKTDMKTLVRDIAILVHTGILDSKDVSLTRTGQQINRKILIIRDPDSRPSEARIKEVEAECNKIPEVPKQQFAYHARREVIEADVKIYTSKPARQKRLGTLSSSSGTAGNTRTRARSGTSKKPAEAVGGSPPAPQDVESLSSFVSSRFKGKKRERKRATASDGTSSNTRQRALDLEEEEMTNLFKLVVIARTFRKNIEFDRLAELFPGFTGKSLKQKWVSLRRKVGGHEVMSRAIEKFEVVARRAVEDKTIRLSDLRDPIDYGFFLDVWDTADSSRIEEVTKVLYYDSEANFPNYDIVELYNPISLLSDQIEGNSSRQKEVISSNHTFYELKSRKKLDGVDQEVERIQTAIRSICLTPLENFHKDTVMKLLGSMGEGTVENITSKMLRDKEIDYNASQEAEKVFSLTEKFDSTLVNKKVMNNFVSKASRFHDTISTVLGSQKAIVLSQGINNGDMISLLNSVSDYQIDMIHVDKAYKLQGYESRLVDKQMLDCDVVIKEIEGVSVEGSVKKVPVPTGRACSHVWIDSQGNILSETWVSIVVSFLWFITYRPGVQKYDLYHKFKTVLSLEDMNHVLQWLEQSNALKSGRYDDYWVDDKWFTIVN